MSTAGLMFSFLSPLAFDYGAKTNLQGKINDSEKQQPFELEDITYGCHKKQTCTTCSCCGRNPIIFK